MIPNTSMGSDAPAAPPAAMPDEGQMDQSPIDQIISQVDSYISDPSKITPETLQSLKADLEDLRAGIEGEEQPEDAGNAPPQGSFSGDIHSRMMGG